MYAYIKRSLVADSKKFCLRDPHEDNAPNL